LGANASARHCIHLNVIAQTIETAVQTFVPSLAKNIDKANAGEGNSRRKDEKVFDSFARIGNGPCDLTNCQG
jgi:uncharacterized protein (DUF2147 family)